MDTGKFIPQELYNLINLCSQNESQKILHPFNTIRGKQKKFNLPLDYPVEVPKQNFEEKLENYDRYKGILFQNDIYEPDGEKRPGKAIAYKITTGPENCLIKQRKSKKQLKVKQKKPKQKFIHNTTKFLDSLELDYNGAMSWIEDYVNNLKLSDLFYLNEDIPFNSVRNIHWKNDKEYNVKGLAKKAREQNKTLINLTGKDCIIENPERFLKAKREDIKNSHWQSLELLRNQCYNIVQSRVNNRLFHVLTSYKSELFPYLSYKGEPLKEIDLGNSQFAILAGIINNELRLNKTDWQQPNIKNWDANSLRLLDAAREGQFYEEIQSTLQLESRTKAKERSMELVFSHFTKTNEDKEQLRESFPQLLDYCESFKKQNCKIGKKFHPSTLPIALQLKESDLFLGPVWRECEKRKIPFVSKHDSVILPANKNLNTNVFKKYLHGQFSEKLLG